MCCIWDKANLNLFSHISLQSVVRPTAHGGGRNPRCAGKVDRGEWGTRPRTGQPSSCHNSSQCPPADETGNKIVPNRLPSASDNPVGEKLELKCVVGGWVDGGSGGSAETGCQRPTKEDMSPFKMSLRTVVESLTPCSVMPAVI